MRCEGNGCAASHRDRGLQTVDRSGEERAGGLTDVTRNVASGVVVTVLSIAYSLSFALLLFSGPLVGSAPRGMALILIGAGLSTLVVAATSSFRLAVAGPDTPTIAVLAAMVAGLTSGAAGNHTGAELELLVVVALAGTTLFVGVMLLVFGALRLGIWIRYVPFPVVGGFLTASGVLLVLGALRLLVGDTLTFSNPPDVTQTRVAVPVCLAVGWAVILFLARARSRHPMLFPILLLCGILIGDASLFAFDISLEEARRLGLMMPPVTISGVSIPWIEAFTAPVNTALLLDHTSEVAVATGITAISILLNATSLEVAEHTQMNLDRELRSNGLANLLVGACGGVVGNLSLNRSQANSVSGATSRLSGIVCGGLCLASIAIGPRVIEWVPVPIVAGLLIYLGGRLIWDWLIRSWPRLSLMDNVLVIAIPVLAVERGYLEAAVLGVIASCIIFAFRYSRIRVVKHDLTRREYSSYVERSLEQSAFLKDNGDLIHIMWIQGYLFFGSANRLLDDGRTRLDGSDGRRIHYLILDLSHVTGIDSSSVLSFAKLADRVRRQGATLVLSGLSGDVRRSFTGTRFLRDHAHVPVFGQVDHALEWAEERLLEEADLGVLAERTFMSWLGAELRRDGFAERLMQYLEAVDLEPGTELFRQGEAADCLYFVGSGRVSVMLQRTNDDPLRLRSVTGFTILGEMGLYREQMRTASVVADEPSRVYRLSKAALERMEHREPEISSALHALIIRILADRLGLATAEISALQR